MRRSLPLIVCTAALIAALPALAAKTQSHAVAKKAAATRSSAGRSGATLHRTSSSRAGRHGKASAVKNPHGHLAQVSMDADRATAIQQALIKSGYMSGEPSGKWDSDSVAAMQKLQADNGWQTKIMPDSRALIKLGLGPSTDNSLSASASTPATVQSGSRE